MLTTRTWSVPSTQAIFIVPSGTSSTPSRSIRLTRRRSPRLRADTGVPLVLEQGPQAVLGIGQRHARDDRLEEAEDDELARLVGRDPAALEVEQLGLVDRPDRAGMRRAAAIGLVDLEARDGDRAGRLREVHPELAEEAVGPDRRAIDDDHPLHERASAGRGARPSTGGCRSCRARRDGCTRSGRTAGRSPPKTISTCSTELRSPSRRLSTRLRTSREPSWASAQWSVEPSPMTADPMLERDGRGGQLLEARDLETRVAAELDLERAGDERLAGVGARSARSPRAPRATVAAAPSPSAITVRDSRARSAAPARQRMMIGRSSRTPAGMSRTTPCDPERPGQLGEPVVGREACAAVEERAHAIRGARGEVGDARQLDARGGRLGRQGGRDEVALVDRRAGRPCRPAGQSRPARSVASGRASRSRARRRAGRRTSCTAGSTRPGAPRTARTPPVRSASEPVLRAGDRADRVEVRPRRPGGRSR